MPEKKTYRRVRNAHLLTLICYDPEEFIDDPEDLFEYIGDAGFVTADLRDTRTSPPVRCVLVTPSRRVPVEDVAEAFGDY